MAIVLSVTVARKGAIAAWAACSAGGVAIAVAGFLPAFSMHVADLAGKRTYTLVGYGTADAWALVASGLVLVVVGAWGMHARDPTAPIVVAGVVAFALAVTTSTVRFAGSDNEGGVYGCVSQAACGGRFLGPAYRDLTREVKQTRPGFELDAGYRAEPRVGWDVITTVARLVLAAAALALFLLRPSLAPGAAGLAALAVVLAAIHVQQATCGVVHDAGVHSALTVAADYLLLVAAAGMLGALSRRRWRWGAIGAASLLLGLPVVYVLEFAASCY